MDEISLEKIKSNFKQVKNILSNSTRVHIDRIEYRTFDEGMCDAVYFICKKSQGLNSLEAFIILVIHKLHFYEEWDILETTTTDLKNIFDIWLLSILEKANFKKLTELEVQEQTQWIVYFIQKLIKKNQNAKNLKYSDRWGIYHNGVEVTPVESFTLPISSDIKLALGLTADWNEIEIFYETSDDYVFFSWFTGA
ncbi:hypothetical protein F908_02919 [Acinetobacter sp. NIPH 284]|uniref:hypothetical protein n=1 Tax=Acinetobacter sp. NIPH 284 TaxID=1217704 RepID=UPI0002D0B980|nr:hypothetical protein [Acinetobacter sp. NIPH 284]ENW79437.1 hypothetical protein F908_02919 [Acinetobacter sp. NIPH 284]